MNWTTSGQHHRQTDRHDHVTVDHGHSPHGTVHDRDRNRKLDGSQHVTGSRWRVASRRDIACQKTNRHVYPLSILSDIALHTYHYNSSYRSSEEDYDILPRHLAHALFHLAVMELRTPSPWPDSLVRFSQIQQQSSDVWVPSHFCAWFRARVR